MAESVFTILPKSYFSCSIAWLIAEIHKECNQDIKFYIWLSFMDGFLLYYVCPFTELSLHF